jgi:DNA-3-methyladenine glycosylase
VQRLRRSSPGGDGPHPGADQLSSFLVLVGHVCARLVEVEAYAGGEDPGSHAFRGPTARNLTMFGRAGHLYVYFTYGMHFCANAVCSDVGVATAVLLRAAAPLEGRDAMRDRRGRAATRDRDLLSGPGKLCQALGLTRDDDGADLVARDGRVAIVDDGTPPPAVPGVSLRIGLSAGADLPWRWYVPGDPTLSRRG